MRRKFAAKTKEAGKQSLLARLKKYFTDEEFADLPEGLSEENRRILDKFRNSD